MGVHFILGGARSGKSSYAERQAVSILNQIQALSQNANKAEPRLHYVATAIPFDEEMQARIHGHQQQRESQISDGMGWQTHESPIELTKTLQQFDHQDIVLIDCLTLWLNNVIFNDGQTASRDQIQQQVQSLAEALSVCPATVLCVSNEVGFGVVPMGEVSRLFVDYAGWMNQAIASIARQVTLLVAGLPLQLKDVNA